MIYTASRWAVPTASFVTTLLKSGLFIRHFQVQLLLAQRLDPALITLPLVEPSRPISCSKPRSRRSDSLEIV